MFVDINTVPATLVDPLLNYSSHIFGDIPVCDMKIKLSHPENRPSKLYANVFYARIHLGHFDISFPKFLASRCEFVTHNILSAEHILEARRTYDLDGACRSVRIYMASKRHTHDSGPGTQPAGPVAEPDTEPPRKSKRARTDNSTGSSAAAESDSPGIQCKVCWDNAATFAFVACGHLCVCADCLHNILKTSTRKCPMCRSSADMGCIKIFT